jgi:asparagine synthetase B (glutamine-hydrolysing)
MFKSVAPDVDVVLTGEGADGMFSMEVGSAASALRFHRKRTIVEKIPLSLRRIGEKALNHTNFPISRRIKRLLKLDSVSFMREQGALFIAGKDPDRVSAEDLIPSLTKIRQNRYKSFYLEYEPRVFEKVTTDSVIRFCQNRGLYTQNRHQYSCYSSLAKEYGLIVAMPFLSGDILPIGLQLPNSLRSDQHGAKPILKKLTCRYLPKEFVYANKLGFEVPLEEWLSGSLYMWRTLLKEEQTKQRAIFDQNIVDELEVKRDSLLIWTAMVMEIFFRQFIDGESLEDTNNYWSKYFLNSQQRKSEINLIKT